MRSNEQLRNERVAQYEQEIDNMNDEVELDEAVVHNNEHTQEFEKN